MAAEPFGSQSLLFGIKGIDLKRAIDVIQPTQLARMTNVERTEEGALIGRQGITPIVTAGAGTSMHSIIRLTGQDIGGNPTHHFVVLVDSTIYWGDSGGLTLVTSPFPFNNPPSAAVGLVPISYSDAPNAFERVWGVIPASGNAGPTTGGANTKVRESDGVTETLGIFSSTIYDPINNRARTTLATENKTTIDNCDVAGWTNNAGTGGAPANAADAVIKKEGAASLKLTTAAGGAPANYYNFWNKANALNLNLVGAQPASDDDIIHLWIRTDRPDLITEFRIYFTVTAAFNVNTVPGTSDTLNTDAYYKSFRPSDFTSIYEVTAATTSGATSTNATLTTLAQLPSTPDVNPAATDLIVQQDPSLRASVQMGGGRGAWQEVGIVGYPLRRGDFGRIGTDTTRNWGNVTGLVLVAQINTNAAANVWLDDIYLTGGSGPDTSPVGATQYDYRYTQFCVETGEESNPSDIQLVTSGGNQIPIDSLRRGITIQPDGYLYVDVGGILTFRQRFYRRGGTLGNNWYFLGVNTSDGGNFTDVFSDLSIVAAPTLEIDNDVPPSMTSIWGPINGILFGCTGNDTVAQATGTGGTLFWSKVDKPGAWPAAYTYEVCSLSEELMAGFAIAGQGFVFSRENLYTHIPDLTNAAVMNVVPTQCKKGLVSRTSFVANDAGVYFCAKDAIYFSPGPGGAEKNISDDPLLPLFRGEVKNGYQPVDWSQPEDISLEMHQNELWFVFTGIGSEGEASDRQVWIFNTLYQFWRHHLYGTRPARFYSEPGQDLAQNSIMLVGSDGPPPVLGFIPSETSAAFDFSAVLPDCHIRTGALDQGVPRVTKLYGDAFIDVDDQGNGGVTITPYINNEEQALTSTTLSPAAPGRQRFYIPIDEILARNISLDISWTPQAFSSLQPIIYQGGVSYTPQPDTSETRVTNWDTQGRLNDKWIKGILLEVDTGGLAKSVNILADGAVQQNISVLASGRQVLQFSFTQFRGRILRLAPTDTVQWILYQHRWIFDEEPFSLVRWESQEVDHGFHGQQVPLFAHISIRSVAPVNLNMLAYRQDGTSTSRNYTLPSTGGAKTKLYVPFFATRGVLFKYTFTGDAPFWLYREESTVRIQPWGEGEPILIAPFGDDDLDQPTRGMVDAGQASVRSGASHI